MKVPEFTRQVTQQGLPNARQTTNVSADSFLDTTQQVALQQVGTALNSVGNAALAIDHANTQARVQDAINQFETRRQDRLFGQNGAFNVRGADVFSQQNSQPLTDNVLTDLDHAFGEIADGLGSDQQRQLFADHVSQTLLKTRGQLLQHENEQARIYRRGVGLAAIDTQQKAIGLNYNDPESVRQSLDAIHIASVDLGKLEGFGEEYGAAKAQQYKSQAISQGITTALAQNDHASATRLLHDFSKDMDVNDMLKAYQTITQENNAKVSFGVAQKVISDIYPRLQTGDGDRALNILLNSESGNRQFQGKFYGLRPDGTPKGSGYLGELKRPDGNIMTEFSVGVEINGKEMDIPTIVPTLTKDEINHLLNMKESDQIPDSIIQKAVDHAQSRIKQGLSVWHDTPQPVTSPKGAVGIAQVMPSTGPEAAKLAGLPWDENRFRNDPDYNKALGSAYFNQQLKDFNGDLAVAYAAYNAGPGATREALDKAAKQGGNWLFNLPAETQAYVTKNMTAYAAGEGQYKRPTLADAHALALAQIGGDNAPAHLRKQVLADVTTQYEEQTKAIKQREEEATAEAMRQLLQNGGKFNDLPVDVRAAVPPKDIDNLMNFGKKIAEGTPVATDWGLYYQLKTNPDVLRKTNLLAFRDKLNDTEFKHLTSEQQSLANSDGTTTRSAKDILNGFMREAGIDPTPKDDDKKGAATVGKIWSVFDQRIADAEQEKGKKLNNEEIQKVAAQLFTKVGVKGVLFGTNEKPAVLIDPQKDKVAVPADERSKIIEAWRTTRPGQPITEDDIFYLYAQHKGLL